MPANAGVSFDSFVQGVCDRNGGATVAGPPYLYVTTQGVTLNFVFPPFGLTMPTPIIDLVGVRTGLAFPNSTTLMQDWPLASGTLLNSDGHNGRVTFHDPGAPLTLTLDLSDASEPLWTEQ